MASLFQFCPEFFKPEKKMIKKSQLIYIDRLLKMI